jgi:hypothetical protein
MTMRKLSSIAVLVVLAVAAACADSSRLAYGDVNSIIAVMSPELWDEVGEEVYDALEPTIQTVRSEKTFTVTYQDPSGEEWGNLRRFRQLLLVGSGDEAWMADALKKTEEELDGPGMYRAYDVWASGQQATIVLTPEGAGADEVRSHLAEINEILDTQYRSYARNRMYMTGADTALADTLMRTARFHLMVPMVYRWSRQDSVFIFRNDNPDPAELIRQVAVSWQSPVPPDMTPEGILDWRGGIAASFGEPQDIDLSNRAAGSFQYRGQDAYQIQATWKNPPELEWPAAGPFITRAVVCLQQDRMYLLDAWLYAPGKEKYEYMIQLETILDSFRCGWTIQEPRFAVMSWA